MNPRPATIGRAAALVSPAASGGSSFHLAARSAPPALRYVIAKTQSWRDGGWANECVGMAGFGQKLKNDPRVSPSFDWAAVRALAQGARGEDPFGLRAEFVQLTRAAEGLR